MPPSDAILARFLALHPKSIDLSLDRILRLLQGLGEPHKRLPPTIHVAGTNGKGSTIALMRAMLEAAGRRVHVYTSPHLVRFHERIRLGRQAGGRFVEEDLLVETLRRCEEVNDGHPITVFEITTAAALLLFSEQPADVLLLEVGLGGRYDATNVIDNPIATVCTPISMDHAEYLGNDVLTIAREKAGIFKPGAPAIIALQTHEDITRRLEQIACEKHAPAIVGGQDFHVGEENGRLVYEDDRGLMDLPLPRLSGRHQQINAATAIATLRHAKGLVEPSPTAFETGLNKAAWPARLQRLSKGHLVELIPPGAELWIDGSHNPDGGRVTAAAMAELGERSDKPLVVIAGMLATKDAPNVFRPFAGLVHDLMTVPIVAQIASRSAEETAACALEAGLPAHPVASVEAALDFVRAKVWAVPPRILITGSLYLAGHALALNGTIPE